MTISAPPGLCVGFYPVGCGGVQDRGSSHATQKRRVVVVLAKAWAISGNAC